MTMRPMRTVLILSVVSLGCAQPQAPADPCNTAEDCPATGNPCIDRSCDLGACTTTPVAKGQPILDQVDGDCQTLQCDGDGQSVSVADDADIPEDGNSCTQDTCNAGSPANTPVASGTSCMDNGGIVCSAAGTCVECIEATNCPGQDTDCAIRVCTDGTCSVSNLPAGMPIATQTAQDCKSTVCDGNGAAMSIADDTDVPSDANDCTTDTCSNGMPLFTNQPVNTTCTSNGGSFCDANGQCLQCNTGSQCSSSVCISGFCQDPSCTDGVKNGDEGDVDCGGSMCALCVIGDGCNTNLDCASGVCNGSACAPPEVISTMPGDGVTGVAVNSSVSVVFSGPMAPMSLVGQTISGACLGTVRLSTDNFATCLGFSTASPVMSGNNTVATWTPAPALSYGSTYAVRVTTGAMGAEGYPLAAQYTSPFGFTTVTPAGATCTGGVVISQVYGGGGNTGATYKSDYVELHNNTNAPVNLAGWSVQYASSAGTTWSVINLNGTIAAGGYYLVGGFTGTTGVALPTADVSSTTNMSATAGKVALVNGTTALTGTCPTSTTIVDLVGFGTANCAEGTNAPAGSNTQSILRNSLGCSDTNDNSVDFTAGATTPRNTMSPPHVCSCVAVGTLNESNVGSEIDFCNLQAPALMTVSAGATTPTVTGRVYEAGVTDPAGAAAGMVVEIGYGSPNINPTTQSGWTFFPTTYNAQIGTTDEFGGTFTAPATPGSYRYLVRASLDGVGWTYCDLNGSGSSAGATFEVTQLGVLTVQ